MRTAFPCARAGVSFANTGAQFSDTLSPVRAARRMIVVPDRATLEGMSRDTSDPVYVMWGDTPYAHVMVKIAADT